MFYFPLSHLVFIGYKESNEELQAQLVSKSLEEGRTLLNHAANNNSLAAEFEAMSENEVKFLFVFVSFLVIGIYWNVSLSNASKSVDASVFTVRWVQIDTKFLQ